MNVAMRIWVMAMALVVSGSASAQDDAPPVTEGRYTGSVEVEAIGPDGSSILTDRGHAEANFAFGEGGKMQIVLRGAIAEDGDNGFEFELLPSETGWTETSEDYIVNLSREGTMTGEGKSPGNTVAWSGQLDADSFLLETEVTLAEPTDKGMAAGTVFIFSYDLDAERSREDNDLEGTGEAGNCSRIEWRIQASPNLFGGGMDLIQVPHCVP